MPSHRTVRFAAVALALALGSGACSRIQRGSAGPPGAVEHGAELLAQLHQRYVEQVPRTMTWSQSNTVFTGTGQVKQSARVVVETPAQMRVDFLPLSGRSGALYLGTRSMTVASGRRSDLVEQPNPALLFAFTVFAAPPGETRKILEEMGIDLSRVRQDEFNGAQAWVIGARKGDLTSNQVWISTRRMLPLRHIRKEERGERTVVTDTRFGTFREFGSFPMATSIEVHRDGRLAMKQSISKVRANVSLPAGTFDRNRWVQLSIRP